MQLGIVLHIQSIVIIFLGIFKFFPLGFSLYYQENDTLAFVLSIVSSMIIGGLLYKSTLAYKKNEIKLKESFAIVSFSWITAALFASFPYIIHAYLTGYPNSGSINHFTDAYFEMMSGLTTTGSSILKDIESLPYGLLFWRSLTHWIGGMGIVLLTVAILPALGFGGMQLYQVEVAGPMSNKIVPRVQETAKILWELYLVLTISATILLYIGGMNGFDALCHAFGTIATGGFSTKNLSIGHYQSKTINTIIMIFMFLASISFSLHYKFLKGSLKIYYKDQELIFYTSIIIIITILLGINHLQIDDLQEIGLGERFDLVIFQVLSVVTTTGYGVGITEGLHFGLWTSFGQFLIIILIMMGGCSGSTSGGIKSLRIYLALKFIHHEIMKGLHPRHIKLIKVGKNIISDRVVLSSLGFIMIHSLMIVIGTFLMNSLEKSNEIKDSFSAIIATMNNIGPGLGRVDPSQNFSNFQSISKWILTIYMLLGRLEFFSIIALLFPGTWKKE